MNARSILTLLVISALLWMSVDYLGLETEGLFTRDALASFGAYVRQFFPPDTSGPFLVKLWSGTLETLAISALATLLAAVVGMLIAVPAAGRFGLAPRLVARFVLNALRSVPELVFAALMVIAAGLGPFPGTLALALHTTGVLGRLFAEALENTPREPANALLHAGSPRIAAFFYGTLPSVLPQCVAYALYRWEINIRMAAVH